MKTEQYLTIMWAKKMSGPDPYSTKLTLGLSTDIASASQLGAC